MSERDVRSLSALDVLTEATYFSFLTSNTSRRYRVSISTCISRIFVSVIKRASRDSKLPSLGCVAATQCPLSRVNNGRNATSGRRYLRAMERSSSLVEDGTARSSQCPSLIKFPPYSWTFVYNEITRRLGSSSANVAATLYQSAVQVHRDTPHFALSRYP